MMLFVAEYLLLNSHSSSTFHSPPSSSIDQTSLKALLISLEGPSFDYQALFTEETVEAVYLLPHHTPCSSYYFCRLKY